MAFLKLENIGKIYVSDGSVAVGIRGVDLSFDIGEFVAVTGQSGSGKSTLLNVISGIDTYEEGELYINGLPTSHYSQEDWEEFRKKYISFVFQDYNIIDSFTVLENVELALSHIESQKERRAKALELIERVGLTAFKKHKGSKLSGGQKQRTVIARALAKDSPIILADEPTGNLDSESAKEIVDLLAELSKDKLVIVVTHTLDELKSYATREVRIFNGAVERDEILLQSQKKDFEEKPTPTQKGRIKRGIELGWHRFKSTPKLSTFVCILMIFAVLGTFFITVSYITDMQISAENNMFVYKEGRLVLCRRDGEPISDDDVKALQKKYSPNMIIRNDFLLDSNEKMAFANDKNDIIFTTDLEYHILQAGQMVDVGRLPSADNEIMLELPLSWQMKYGKNALDSTSFDLQYLNDTDFVLTGVRYYYDNTIPAGKIIMTQQALARAGKIFANSGERKSMYFITDAFNAPLSAAEDKTLKDGEYYIKYSVYNEFIENEIKGQQISDFRIAIEELSGKSVDFNGMKLLHSRCTEIDIKPKENVTYSVDGYYVEAPLAMDDKLSEDIVLYLSSGDFDRLYTDLHEANYKQLSLVFDSDAEAKSHIADMREDGYNAIFSGDTYRSSLLSFGLLSVIISFVVWAAMIIFFGFFLYLCTARMIIAKQKDIGILRSMGIENNVIKISTYAQTAISMIPAVVFIAILACVFYTTPQLNYILPFIHAREYLLILLGLVILNVSLTRRYNKKMFKISVKDTLKGGEKV